MHVAVLTYHAMNIDGDGYDDNDHVALASDLDYLVERGFLFLPAIRLVEILRSGKVPRALRGKAAVTLTCDDGSDYDFRDLEHERQGRQKGFHTLLEERDPGSNRWNPWASPLRRPQMTSFVVASPEARSILDRKCMTGRSRWQDDWWGEALASGLMHLGNHSWDHLNEALPRVAHSRQTKGDFFAVDNPEDADRQILRAREYIRERAPNPADRLFAYPYGHVSPFLADEYFPADEQEHGILGAFSTEPAYVTPATDPYRIPRFVCGCHWHDPAGFRAIVDRSRVDG